MEEADGGARRESHPDPTACLDHVSDAGFLLRVGFKGLLWGRERRQERPLEWEQARRGEVTDPNLATSPK